MKKADRSKMMQVVVALCMVGLVSPLTAQAKGGKSWGKDTSPPSDIYVQYDKNADGKLDDAEKDAMRKDYEKDPAGPLKAFDLNSDGKLSDDEISAIPATKPGEAPAKKNKKQK